VRLRSKSVADHLKTGLELVHRLIAEAEPKDVWAVAEPLSWRDAGLTIGELGIEPSYAALPKRGRVELDTTDRPRVRTHPADQADLALDPLVDRGERLSEKRAPRREENLCPSKKLCREDLIECPARDGRVELCQA
jgi:hypothetical protein